jgi:hypothetical protein
MQYFWTRSPIRLNPKNEEGKDRRCGPGEFRIRNSGQKTFPLLIFCTDAGNRHWPCDFPRPDDHDSGKFSVSVKIAMKRHVDNYLPLVL